ncbi:UPF0481 protein At3g47200-like [Diospyros lotus]|uniref:UPF0481 protein At3g47200-like n=1 Tax=Diospyros lotus TaxID=55363 RepID=UPI00225B89E9|nr:UPF0481 protein At3g47200-like [Diospyros lotus]
MEKTENKGEYQVIEIPKSGAHDQKSTPPRGKEIANNGEIIETREPDGRGSSSRHPTLALLQSRLLSISRPRGIYTSTSNHSASIYRVPKILAGMSTRAVEPEIVSVGPYHRGKEHLMAFEKNKLQHLNSFLSREGEKGDHFLQQLIEAMEEEESRARECYSEAVDMSSEDFVMMMVIDCCFILELFLQFGDITAVHSENDGNLVSMITTPWLLPIISRDLLKLENQIPFFLLRKLFDLLTPDPQNRENYLDSAIILSKRALIFFSLFRPLATKQSVKQSYLAEPKHLLQLFRSSKVLSLRAILSYNYNPSSIQPMQCVRQLWSSGVKFRPRREINGKAVSFLDITFNEHNRVLEIPTIHIDDLTNTILINCMAFERGHSHIEPHFSAYIAFLSCLIKSARDVALLSSCGIIINSSQSDQQVAEFFRQLEEKAVVYTQNCYLSSVFRKVEDYYSSNLAKLRRTYFRRPWTFISVVSAAALLILTAIQTYAAVSKQ